MTTPCCTMRKQMERTYSNTTHVFNHRLLSVARTTTFCFTLAALATVCSTFVAFFLMGHRLGFEGWKVIFCQESCEA